MLELGRGLHAIQDIEAHGNIRDGLGHWRNPEVDDIFYVWADSTRTTVIRANSAPYTRIENTYLATVSYLTRFTEGVGGVGFINSIPMINR
jgi:hypothetical protein